MTTSKEQLKLRKHTSLLKSNNQSLKSKDLLLLILKSNFISILSFRGGNTNGGGNDENTKEEDKMQDALSQAIVREKPNVKWADVAGLE